MKLNEEIQGRGDKIATFGWSMVDKPGVFEMIDKRALVVDKDYQRGVKDSDAKIKRIAARWSWVACGVLIVARRDGALFVVDGQHRARAAMKRSDIQRLPCIIFESMGQKEEAESFLRANKDRKPMTSIQSFNAMITAQDRTAMVAKELLDMADLVPSTGNSKGNFNAVGALMKCITIDEDVMRRIWPVVVDLSGSRTVHNDILVGIFELERRMPDGLSLSDKKFHSKLLAAGREDVLQKINQARAFMGVGGDRPRMQGVLGVINHRLQNKIEID